MDKLNTILLGNCENVLKNVEDESVHLTVTSPPYYNAKEYSTWTDYNAYLNFLNNTFKEIYRITHEGRMCVVNLSPVIDPRKSRSHESKRLAIPFHFFSLMENMGWKYIDDIVWVKPEGTVINRNASFFQHRKPVAYKPNVVTETIFVFQKPSDFLIDKVVRSYEGNILQESLVADEYERSNVWEINAENKSKHLAPFPKELSDKLIQYYSFVGDTVLDPFMGSGTTAISCVDLNRQYLGIEIHEEYKEMAEERIQSYQPLNNFLEKPSRQKQ